MDERPYFLFGDVLSNVLVALLTALAVDALFSPGWSMPVAMFLAMLLGMGIASLCCVLLLMRFFGAMEIMLPTMLTGMLVGMLVGMSRVMTDMKLIDHGLLAGVIALLCTASIWALDQRLGGEQLTGMSPSQPGVGETGPDASHPRD